MQDNNIKKLWHTNRKCFIEEFSILQTINSEGNYEHTYFEYNHKTQELERLSTCQVEEVKCTGLKDKNGKLIYEGDIVKVFHLSSTMQPSIFIGEVKYNQKQGYWLIENNGAWSNFLDTDDIFEVIGNVYENPELLNKEEE